MTAENERIVADFCKAWSRRNLDEILSFMAEDAVYHNIPLAPARGKQAIKAVIDTFLPGAQSIEFRILNTVCSGNLVFNERVDVFQIGAKHIELPVAGVFEVKGGKIAAWRDYFDLSTWQKQMQ